MKISTKPWAQSLLCSLLIICISGCASGRINSGWPFPVEAAAPARVDQHIVTPSSDPNIMIQSTNISKDIVRKGVLRQLQPDMNAILIQELRNHGVTVDTNTSYNPNQSPLAKVVNIGGLDARQQYSRLTIAVNYSSDSKSIRNNIVSHVIEASTADCNVYVLSLRSTQVSGRLLTDLMSIGFGTAGSLAKSARTATKLAAFSGLSTATGASIDRNIFAQQGAELIADTILIMRKEGRAHLEKRMKDDDYETWPLGLAMADVYDFHNDCSMLRGFSRLRTAVLAREETLQALRKAAAELVIKNGTGAQVQAVYSGLSIGTVIDSRSDDAPSHGIGAVDVEARFDKGKTCLDALKAATAAPVDLTTFVNSKPDSCTFGDTVWEDDMTEMAMDAITEALKPEGPLGQQKTALNKDRSQLSEAEKTDIQNAVDAVYADYRLKADKRVSEVRTMRTKILAFTQNVDTNADADQIIGGMEALAPATKDIVILRGIHVVKQLKTGGGMTGKDMAAAAHDAMINLYQVSLK